MRYIIPFVLLFAACSAPTEAPITVLSGAYTGVSINGAPYPVNASALTDGSKLELIAERLWLGGSAGTNAAVRRLVYRATTTAGVSHVDSTTTTGTFYPTLAKAQTSFGAVAAVGTTLTLNANDGTIRIFARDN